MVCLDIVFDEPKHLLDQRSPVLTYGVDLNPLVKKARRNWLFSKLTISTGSVTTSRCTINVMLLTVRWRNSAILLIAIRTPP